MEDGGKNGAADHDASEGVGVIGPVTFGVAFGALAVAGEAILPLLDAGDNTSSDKGDGIDGGAQGELVLLAGGEWLGIPDVAGIEVGEDAEDALFFLNIDLLLGKFDAGKSDADAGAGGGDLELNRRHGVILAGSEKDFGAGVRAKALGGDRNFVGTGRQGGEIEGAGTIGGLGLFCIGEIKSDLGTGDYVSGGVGDGTVDATTGGGDSGFSVQAEAGERAEQNGAEVAAEVSRWNELGQDLFRFYLGWDTWTECEPGQDGDSAAARMAGENGWVEL